MMDLTKLKKLAIGGVELKQLLINGIQVWKSGYKNWVPLSIDTDGSIYEGVGYLEGYRLSSGGGLSAQANTVTTGFIPCKASDLIRMAGVDWKPAAGYCYLSFYDAAFALLGSVNVYPSDNITAVDGHHGVARGICKLSAVLPTIGNGITTFDHFTFTDGSEVAYFRVNGIGSGADMIVTVNEEIA